MTQAVCYNNDKTVDNLFTSKGLLPDPEKDTAINEMPAPEEKISAKISRYDQLPISLRRKLQ